MSAVSLEQAIALALNHHRAGQLPAAEGIYRQILAVAPDHAEAWHLLGLIALVTGRLAEAESCISRAVNLNPNYGPYHCDLGVALRCQGRYEEAIQRFRQTLIVQPDSPEGHNNLGEALATLGQHTNALESFRQAIALRPTMAQAHNNLGMALAQTGEYDAAFASFDRALTLDPRLASAHNNVANTFLKMERWPDAVAAFDRAIAIQPNFADALAMRGRALLEMENIPAAAEAFQKAIAYGCQFVDAHLSLGLIQLFNGQYEQGWQSYEWRLRLAGIFLRPPQPTVSRWDGSPAPGQTILVQAEQGFGDLIQFLRYLPLMRERAGAARILLECQPELCRLVKESVPADVEVIPTSLNAEVSTVSADQQIPFLSLPLVLGQLAPLPMTAPYLRADAEARAVWREWLGGAGPFRVGIAWAGRRAHRRDRHRSIDPERLRPLLDVPGIRCYSLQVDARGALPPSFIDATEGITDFADTAALLAELDLIITVDTATAHLAGALGRPVWTLLPTLPDWRWGSEGDTTPWYPSMRLFRQKTQGDWAEVIQRVGEALRTACAASGNG